MFESWSFGAPRAGAVALLAGVFLLAGCSSQTEPERQIGEAYAGPAALKLHQEIDPRSPETVTVPHGERLIIIKRRRRFVKVRTTKGGEGWTDIRQLLASTQMEALNSLAETAQQMPSQGAATVYEALNVHTEPNRFSPSFYRIKEGELVDVVQHKLGPRVPFEATSVLPASAAKPKRARKPRQEPAIPRPPMPPPPKLPEDWEELSKANLPPELQDPEPEPEPPKPIPVDDWSLVRLKSGRAGWVLTGMLKMNIPDEVAQYSEGARITAYFPMSDISDGGHIRHHWLWTTLSKVHQDYEFDSFRFFIWNVKHHRYETAHVERNLRGYAPVEVRRVKMTVGKKEDTFAGFTLILEDDHGVRWRKNYVFQYYRVVLVGKEQVPKPLPDQPTAIATTTRQPAPAQPPAQPSLYARLKQNLARWFGKK